ncbi:MAG: hypothetical protein EXS42_06580 [Lacunisphaera sp.]|nr:hypothetical protein [Lacunisphaera sp.]
MKQQLTKFLLMVTVLGFAIKAGASDRWETLRAINWVENPNNKTNAGRFGELGPYQFRSGTWRMHTTRPFSLANQRAAADEVAVKHYEWIKRTLEQAGVQASPSISPCLGTAAWRRCCRAGPQASATDTPNA